MTGEDIQKLDCDGKEKIDKRHAYKIRHVKLGLCSYCSQPAYRNHRLCLRHKENDRLRSKRKRKYRYNLLKYQGKCCHCGSLLDEDMDSGMVTCLTCRQN